MEIRTAVHIITASAISFKCIVFVIFSRWFFPHCPLKKGDRVGKPYPLFHDVKRARFSQRTSPSVLCRKEACMAGV